MHIRPDEETGDLGRGDRNTRGKRAAEAAYKRQKARHVERDYFGRPLEPIEVPSAKSVQTIKQKPDTVRLDAWLVSNGYSSSREKSKDLITQGLVEVKGIQKVKASTPIGPSTVVIVREPSS